MPTRPDVIVAFAHAAIGRMSFLSEEHPDWSDAELVAAVLADPPPFAVGNLRIEHFRPASDDLPAVVTLIVALLWRAEADATEDDATLWRLARRRAGLS